MIAIFFFLIFAVLLEGSLTTLPLAFLIILFAAVATQRKEVFVMAFFAGLFLDLIKFREVGFSSAYFLLFVLAVYLYRSKFEIRSISFVGLFSFFGSLGYLILSGVRDPLLNCLLASALMIISFRIFEEKSLQIA